MGGGYLGRIVCGDIDDDGCVVVLMTVCVLVLVALPFPLGQCTFLNLVSLCPPPRPSTTAGLLFPTSCRSLLALCARLDYWPCFWRLAWHGTRGSGVRQLATATTHATHESCLILMLS